MFEKRPVLQQVERDGEIYSSLGKASYIFGVTRRTIKQRCLSEKYPSWKLLNTIDQGETLKNENK